jgi:hypothetical protein
MPSTNKTGTTAIHEWNTNKRMPSTNKTGTTAIHEWNTNKRMGDLPSATLKSGAISLKGRGMAREGEKINLNLNIKLVG